MDNSMIRGTLLVFLLLMVAGCSQPASTSGHAVVAPSASTQNVAATAQAPTAGPETGGIRGLVTDEELRPLGGAAVALMRANETTFSAADGAFSFSDIAPGEHVVAAQRLGFEESSARIIVQAGAIAETRIILKAVYVPVPRQLNYIGAAFLDLSIVAPATSSSPNVTGTSVRNFQYHMDPDVVSVVTALAWQSGTPGAARWMYLDLWIFANDCKDICKKTNETRGPSPLRTRLDDVPALLDGYQTPGVREALFPTSCYTTVGSTDVGPCAGAPDAAAALAFQQKLQLYTSVFFVGPAPSGFDPLPT